MSEWQPTETAPSDILLLVWDGSDISVAHKSNLLGSPIWFAEAGGGLVYDNARDLMALGVSHWLPLPEPPISTP